MVELLNTTTSNSILTTEEVIGDIIASFLVVLLGFFYLQSNTESFKVITSPGEYILFTHESGQHAIQT